MNFYRRKLPHWQPEGAQYFITFRLVGSLPRTVIEELILLREQFKNSKESDESNYTRLLQRQIFQKYEEALDTGKTGPTWLKNQAVADVIEEAMHYRNSAEYDLFAYMYHVKSCTPCI